MVVLVRLVHFPGETFRTLLMNRMNGHETRILTPLGLNEAHLRRILKAYIEYYHEARAHLSMERDSPVPREVEPASRGKVISIPQLGGLTIAMLVPPEAALQARLPFPTHWPYCAHEVEPLFGSRLEAKK